MLELGASLPVAIAVAIVLVIAVVILVTRVRARSARVELELIDDGSRDLDDLIRRAHLNCVDTERRAHSIEKSEAESSVAAA